MLWRLIVFAAIVIGLLFLANDIYVVSKIHKSRPAFVDESFSWAILVEALFWAAIGMGLIVRAACLLDAKRDGWRTSALAAVTLIAFGVSDVVGAITGAWWRPWWLLLWKAVCVGLLLALIIRAIIARRTQQRSSGAPASANQKARPTEGEIPPGRWANRLRAHLPQPRKIKIFPSIPREKPTFSPCDAQTWSQARTAASIREGSLCASTTQRPKLAP